MIFEANINKKNRIIGIGTDITRIPRIEKLLESYNEHLLRRILSEQEVAVFHSLPSHKHASFLAKRFAGKEAVAKAIGFGIGQELSFKDIAILNDKKGKPYVEIKRTILPEFIHIDISLSDDYPIAIAFVIISNIS